MVLKGCCQFDNREAPSHSFNNDPSLIFGHGIDLSSMVLPLTRLQAQHWGPGEENLLCFIYILLHVSALSNGVEYIAHIIETCNIISSKRLSNGIKP